MCILSPMTLLEIKSDLNDGKRVKYEDAVSSTSSTIMDKDVIETERL